MMKLATFLCGTATATAGFGNVDFDGFLKEFGKSYPDKVEYELRKTLFETRKASFAKHNAQGHSFTLGLNQFADMSAAEIKAFKGFNKAAYQQMRAANNFTATSPPHEKFVGDFPASLDWRTKNAITPVKNQGGCGSCWAFGSAETLESHTFLHGKGDLPILSPQQLVDCAPNPNHCGGTGGCGGSIPELAYDYVKKAGMASESDYPYRGFDQKCKIVKPTASCTGYVGVKSNNYTAVMTALQYGPLAITVAAQPWEFYNDGVFTECPHSDIDLDHVVQLVGYGTDSGMDYWIVRNSWGEGWGERGYIRIQRHSDSDFCTKDNTPADGTGCNGGPSVITACGSCGILYDAVYPTV
jgi:cathepsin L